MNVTLHKAGFCSQVAKTVLLPSSQPSSSSQSISTIVLSQDFCKAAKSHRQEHSGETGGNTHKIKRYSESESWDSPRYQPEKYDQEGSLSPADSRLSDGSMSPDRIYGETSPSVPLHPTKRPASNPPPISNQATKGTKVIYMYFLTCLSL